MSLRKNSCSSDKMPHIRLLSYLKPYKKRFSCALLAMVVFGLTDGAVPFLIKEVLDEVFASRNQSALYYLPFILVGFAVVRGTASFFQRYLTASVGLRVVRDIRHQICEKLLGMSASFFGANSSGNLVAHMTNDTLLIRTAITDAAASVVRDSIRIVALVCAACYLDPLLGAIALIGLPICIWPVVKFGKRVRKFSKVGQDVLGVITGRFQEIISGIRVIQDSSREASELSKFSEENSKFTATFERAEKFGALSTPTNEVIASIAISAVLVYGGLSVISGVRSQGDFIAFLTALFLLYEPVKKLGRVNAVFQQGIAASQRIFSLLDKSSDIVELPDAAKLPKEKLAVTFNDVWFSYRNTSKSDTADWTLSGLSLEIHPGSTVALVGESGGGKSTLARLLLREYDVQRGSVSISGIDVRDCSLKSLRRNIAYVEQEPFLFNTTVYENVSYAEPSASKEEVYSACVAANCHDFILELPQQYDTQIGERGSRLSGGQRARLAIARALLKNSPILILDEATAALDSDSEKAVQEAIERLMVGRTVLVIAHRLATVIGADEIVVISGGEIVERGTHKSLIESNSVYARLSAHQFDVAKKVEGAN